MSIDVKYRTAATATGGREGHVRSQDGTLDLVLSTPKEIGGPGNAGTNPEQLFASGYSACFLGAMKFAGRQVKVAVPDDAEVTALVGIGLAAEGGFGLDVELRVSLPNVDETDARRLIEAAHQNCPYSRATRGNIEVRLSLA